MSELNFTHSNGNKVKLTTPDTLAANKTFKLPGADGSSGQAMVTDGNGAFSFASIPAASIAGITMMDQWRIASDNNKGNNEVIDSNWERSDTFFAQIGTGMSQSSGIFTFPQTGIYLILAQTAQYATNHYYAGFKVQVSTNSGSDYSDFTFAYGNHLGGGCYENVHIHGVLDVTNASTFRLRMYTATAGTTQYSGSTNAMRTGMTFIRLGDT